ncbi:hypothetical protein HDU92_005101 [Lobulomyces angularis]|nr:hypothetical protein HDU92_005101 [Lobulomyces angularis]
MTIFSSCISAFNEPKKDIEKNKQDLSSEKNQPLIPIDLFFANPEKMKPKISPDGKYISFLQQFGEKKNLAIFIQDLNSFLSKSKSPQVIAFYDSKSIQDFFWTISSKYIIYRMDKDGDENFHLYRADIESFEIVDLTPYEGTINMPILSKLHPDKLLIHSNHETKKYFDAYILDVETASITLRYRNNEKFRSFFCNENLEILLAIKITEKGEKSIFHRKDESMPFTEILVSKPDENLDVKKILENEAGFIYYSNINRNTLGLFKYDFETKVQSLIFGASVDVVEIKLHPKTNQPQAIVYDSGRKIWNIFDNEIENDFKKILSIEEQADIVFEDVTPDDNIWCIRLICGDKPAVFYLYNRTEKKLHFLFSSRSSMENLKLGKMESVNFKARDGLELQGYFTYPPDFNKKERYPLVLVVHGGPQSRCYFGFKPIPHWLADRGYVVFQPNFRGSNNFNKELMTKGYKQWGSTIQTDLMDSVLMTVEKGFIDRRYVAIYGTSFGGYSALCGLSMSPDFYTCGISRCGPSNIISLLNATPAKWESIKASLYVTIGHPEQDEELLKKFSPLTYANKIIKPLFIAQGGNDVRVPTSESEEIVAAIEKNGGSVKYALYPNEGHNFTKPSNKTDFFQKCEIFLKEHMGEKPKAKEGLEFNLNIKGSSAICRTIN